MLQFSQHHVQYSEGSNGTTDASGSTQNSSSGKSGGLSSSTLDLLILLGLCTVIMIVLIYVLFRVAWGQARDFIHMHHEEEEARKARIARRCKSYMIPEGMKIVVMPGNEVGYALISTSPARSIGFQPSVARSTNSEYPPPLYHADLQSNYSTEVGNYQHQDSSSSRPNSVVRFDSSTYDRVETPHSQFSQNEPLLNDYREQKQEQRQQSTQQEQQSDISQQSGNEAQSKEQQRQHQRRNSQP
eukprot:TRINITY_DN4162_c1_g1_i1.p2 TRINITY_DN4162_c1_g1~~TRINITY_DN4162_c1_g1_i1.p2  ORF type:complete len:281 (+),score=8.05 TRINITY_DN4162_c1_g1_i1:115-843(+)